MRAIRILKCRFNRATVVSVHKVLRRVSNPPTAQVTASRYDNSTSHSVNDSTRYNPVGMLYINKRPAQSASCSLDINLSAL